MFHVSNAPHPLVWMNAQLSQPSLTGRLEWPMAFSRLVDKCTLETDELPSPTRVCPLPFSQANHAMVLPAHRLHPSTFASLQH